MNGYIARVMEAVSSSMNKDTTVGSAWKLHPHKFAERKKEEDKETRKSTFHVAV